MDAPAEEPEVETFFTFTWAGKKPEGRRPRPDAARQNRRPQKAKGGERRGKPDKPKNFKSAPPKKDKPIDPDNPFAALAAHKDKG